MRRALVTGASGFLGGVLLRELLRRGWEVRALIRPASDRRGLTGLEGSFDIVWGDLLEREPLRAAVKDVDTVFHVAGRYSLWNPNPAEIYRDNVDGARNILEAAAEAGVPRIVHTSTVGVLRASRGKGVSDENNLNRREELDGHYKRSKWDGDRVAAELADRGAPIVIVHPSTPVGPWDVKPTPTGAIIVDFLQGHMFGYTNTGLNLVPVEDVAVGHVLAADRGVVGRRYILGGENLSLRAFMNLLSELTGLPAPRWRIPRRILLPVSAVMEIFAKWTGKQPRVSVEEAYMAQKYMYFDSSRARKELGYAPGDVRSALARAVDWFRAHGYVRDDSAPREGVKTERSGVEAS